MRGKRNACQRKTESDLLVGDLGAGRATHREQIGPVKPQVELSRPRAFPTIDANHRVKLKLFLAEPGRCVHASRRSSGTATMYVCASAQEA